VSQKNKGVGALKIKLLNQALESTLWRVIGAMLLFFMHIVLARYLSPANYGVYSFSLSITMVLALVATMGWPKSLLRLVPQYISRREWSLLRGLLIRCHQFTFGLAIFISALLLVARASINDEYLSNVLFYVSLMLPILSLAMLRRSVFQGFHCVKGSIIPDEIAFPALMLVGLLLVKPSLVETAIYLYVSIAAAIFLMTLVWLYRLFPIELKEVYAVYDMNTWRILTFPLLLGGLYQIVLNQSGLLLLGAFGGMIDTGLYSASFRLAALITFIMTAINVIGMPMMSTAFHSNDINSLRDINKKTRVWSVLGALPLFVAFMFFPKFVLKLFGDEFENAAILLQIISVGQLGNATVGLAGSLLVVAGEQVYFMRSMLVVTVVCVLGMVFVIPIWGAVGVACVFSLSMIILSVLQLLRANTLFEKV